MDNQRTAGDSIVPKSKPPDTLISTPLHFPDVHLDGYADADHGAEC